jgi:hypothetical protein
MNAVRERNPCVCAGIRLSNSVLGSVCVNGALSSTGEETATLGFPALRVEIEVHITHRLVAKLAQGNAN